VVKPYRNYPGSFVPSDPRVQNNPFIANPTNNPFVSPGAVPALSTTRDVEVQGKIPTPSGGALAKSIRLGNTEVITTDVTGFVPSPIPGEPDIPNPNFRVMVLDINLQTVDPGAADSWVHHPGSWVITAFATGNPSLAASFVEAEILLGSGGAAETIRADLVPALTIPLHSSTARMSVKWKENMISFAPGQALSVKVTAFLHRTFTAGNARETIFLTNSAPGNAARIPLGSTQFLAFGMSIADNLTLSGANGYSIDQAQMDAAIHGGFKFPTESFTDILLVSGATEIVAVTFDLTL
jgi:hypothetical protein